MRLPWDDSMQAWRPPSPGTGEGLRSQAQGEGATAVEARRAPDRPASAPEAQQPDRVENIAGTRRRLLLAVRSAPLPCTCDSIRQTRVRPPTLTGPGPA